MRRSEICIVGAACEYPDARTPDELFENVLAGRRAFRRIPNERLPAGEYVSDDPDDVDHTYVRHAALIEGWTFDRTRFRIVGSTHRAADPTHWLALDVADRALADAGFAAGAGLPRERTGVVIGNTLTGEFSRAQGLRLRWPYVRRVVAEALQEVDCVGEAARDVLLRDLELRFKAPFEPVGDESLAGALANTIAGRICNHYDLGGGGFTVDGACSSSLLAVSQACGALAAGDLDVALAGGVDLSLDPFELVGFARTGALARSEMRVYDRRAEGFWPGEGCGVLVLMREDDARAGGCPVLARVAGWGVASDGAGGLTRPERAGQLRALHRAYERARIAPGTVGYFEGHGTGTVVGDATELGALSELLAAAGVRPDAPTAIGSIKANIGHTKAAAGVAGILKAVFALRQGLLPPQPGCSEPHEGVDPKRGALLRVPARSELWPENRGRHAGVSSFGFGGIDVHVVLSAAEVHANPGPRCMPRRGERVRRLSASARDVEVFALGGDSVDAVAGEVSHLLHEAGHLSFAELGDLAGELAARSRSHPPAAVRVAVIASRPETLARALEALLLRLPRLEGEGETLHVDAARGVFLGRGRRPARIGFLFPGQAAPVRALPAALASIGERDTALHRLRRELFADYAAGHGAETGEGVDTALAQPAIVAGSLLAARAVERLGLRASLGVGHSVGEIGAMAWSGALPDVDAALLAAARGRVVARVARGGGAMATLVARVDEVAPLLADEPVVVAAHNAPGRSVVSGDADAIARVIGRAAGHGIRASRLSVSHAFHSPHMEPCRRPFARVLERTRFATAQEPVFSTVTGGRLPPQPDWTAHLLAQLTAPVRFEEALARAAAEVDVFVELGPGEMLSALAAECTGVPAVSLDAGHPGFRGLHTALAACFAAGAPIDWGALFAERALKPFDLERPRCFLASPCGDGVHPLDAGNGARDALGGDSDAARPTETPANVHTGEGDNEVLEVLRERVALHCELPLGAIRPDDRFLSDLHLTSIAVSELASSAARALGRPPLLAPAEFSDATLLELAAAIASDDRQVEIGENAAGVDAWVRPFEVRERERRPPREASRPAADAGAPHWQAFAAPDDPVGELLRAALADAVGGEGVLLHLCASPSDAPAHTALVLDAARATFDGLGARRFVLVHHGDPAVAVVRCLHHEARSLETRIVEVPEGLSPEVLRRRVVREVRAAAGYLECRYDADGRRFERSLALLAHGGFEPGGEGAEQRLPVPVRHVAPAGDGSASALGLGDVLLVTGGGKGIAAECAMNLALGSGCALALVGRGDPEGDGVLREQLSRLEAAGIRFIYASADVTDADAVQRAVEAACSRLGPVTAVIHGAGVNVPAPLAALEPEDFEAAARPKVQGLRNVLSRLDPERLRHVVAFGSVIAEIGLPGEAHYALANERMARELVSFAREHPRTRCLCVDWSIWSGVGMGERLGRIEVLAARNVTAITPEEGVAWLGRLLRGRDGPVRVFLAGRVGGPPTLAPEPVELPLGRFLEQVREHTPGVELVAEANLAHERDLVLRDHVHRGTPLLPGVIGLEAMAQVASALCNAASERARRPSSHLRIEHVAFAQPVVVSPGETLRVRIAGLVRAPGRVEVVLRTESTRFAVDHMRAVFEHCPGDAAGATSVACDATSATSDGEPAVPDAGALYGDLFFQGPRLARVRCYEALHWDACRAQIEARPEPVFGPFEPAACVLGDPGARDAAVHALQACVPDRELLPVGVERIDVLRSDAPGMRRLIARERSRGGGVYVYDLELRDAASGCLLERWHGLELREVARRPQRRHWHPGLVAPRIEEIVSDVLPDARLRIGTASGRDRSASARAVAVALGRPIVLHRRADGRPWVDASSFVSISHAAGRTFAVSAARDVACDVEPVVARSPDKWRDLLGGPRFEVASELAEASSETLALAATRLFGAGECIRKLGLRRDVPVVVAPSERDGAQRLRVGSATTLVSVAFALEGAEAPLVFSVLC